MTWKRFIVRCALAAALVLAAPLAAVRTVGASSDEPDATFAQKQGAALPSTALGGLAAVGCGFMVRATIITGGTQVGTIAGAVACCGYMLFDALVIERN